LKVGAVREYRIGITRSILEAIMKLLSIVPLAAALATATAMAQSVSLAELPVTTALPSACPIGLTVQHGGLFVEKETAYGSPKENGTRLRQAVQRVHLSVTNPSAHKITEVQLAVHGFSDKGRTFTLTSAVPDVVKRITLALDIKGNGQASTDLSLTNWTAVSSVDITSVRYEGGSAWRATPALTCTVSPNALMLVSSR
jgi:hypothetical protein